MLTAPTALQFSDSDTDQLTSSSLLWHSTTLIEVATVFVLMMSPTSLNGTLAHNNDQHYVERLQQRNSELEQQLQKLQAQLAAHQQSSTNGHTGHHISDDKFHSLQIAEKQQSEEEEKEAKEKCEKQEAEQQPFFTKLYHSYFPSPAKYDYGFETPSSYVKKLRGIPLTGDHPESLFICAFTAMTAFAALAILGSISQYAGQPHNFQWFFAYNGASAAIVFAIPTNVAGSPRHMFVGHAIGGITSVVIVHYIFGVGRWIWLAGSLSVGFSIFFMQLTSTINPPSAAGALFYATAPTAIQEYKFLYVGCMMVGAAVIVLCGIVFNNLPRRMKYPTHWF